MSKGFFTKSKDGVLLSIDVMIAKLKSVINFTVLPDDNTSSIKPVNELNNLMEERKSKLKDTIFELRLKHLINQKKKEVGVTVVQS